MEIAAAGWDRAMQFTLSDSDPNDVVNDGADGVFKASGLVRAKEFGYRPKKAYYYVHSMKEILRGTLFDKELSVDPQATDVSKLRIMRFRRNLVTNSPNTFGDYVYSVWLPTANNEKVLNRKIALGADITGVTTGATLVTLQAGDLNGVRTSLQVTFENGQFVVTIPEVSERPIFFILGGSQPDNTLAVTSIPEVSATGVSCDAIKVSWSWPSGRPTVNNYRVYYYEKNDSEENLAESKAFNISDKNLVLFTDNLQGTMNGGQVNEVLISGLKKTLDQYYIFVQAIDVAGVVTPINTATANKGWATATTLVCPNNIITGVTAQTNTPASQRALQLFNYTDVKFCYPQTFPAISSLGEFTRDGETIGTNITASINLGNNFIIEGIAVLDGNGEGDILIQGQLGTQALQTILNIRTNYFDAWRYFPVNKILANTLRIELLSDAAKLRKIVLYGRPSSQSALTASCLNCDGTNVTNLTVVGTNSSSVTNISQLRSQGFLPSSTATSKNIRVNGSLVVDEDYTFATSKFFMKPGASITVNTDKQFNVNSTDIDGCEQMWKGITIKTGGKISMDKSILRDAVSGLKFERSQNYYEWDGRQTFSLIDSRIERNIEGLNIPNNVASSAFNWFSYDITSNSRIGGTIFDGTENDLKPCYPGQVLDPNDCQKKAIRGLSIWDAFVTVDDAVKTNLIQNLGQGIFVYNGYLSLNTTRFKNIKPTQVPNPYYPTFGEPTFPFGGEGVLVSSGYLNQRGLGSNLLTYQYKNAEIDNTVNRVEKPFTFEDVYAPFYTSNSWFNLYGNKIRGTGQDALIANLNAPNGYSCYFENNFVSTKANGVRAFTMAFPGHYPNYYSVEIIDNYIENQGNKEVNSAVGTGIHAASYAEQATAMNVSRNYIQTQNGLVC